MTHKVHHENSRGIDEKRQDTSSPSDSMNMNLIFPWTQWSVDVCGMCVVSVSASCCIYPDPPGICVSSGEMWDRQS